MSLLRTVAFFLLLGSALAQDTRNTWMKEGVRAFTNGRYRDAAVAFQKCVDVDPSAVHPRLLLASAWMNQYIPGAASPENLQIAGNAERGFLGVLNLDPRNVTALESLASLKHLRAQGAQSEADKLNLLEDARHWYLRVVEADATRKEAYYALGVIGWATWYPAWNAARTKLGMRPDVPGPLADPIVRAGLRSRYQRTLQDGIDYLNKALELDPKYDDAMAYMNLLVRESADLADSRDEYQRMILEADAWVQKALETRRENVEQGAEAARGATVSVSAGSGGRPECPPEPATEAGSPPSRIAISGSVSKSSIIRDVLPVYPQEAKAAGIEGTVRLRAVLAKDGSVQQLEVESGHPLLSPAALEAVRQWTYKPTLLNGEPVEVVTDIDVSFVLDKTK